MRVLNADALALTALGALVAERRSLPDVALVVLLAVENGRHALRNVRKYLALVAVLLGQLVLTISAK